MQTERDAENRGRWAFASILDDEGLTDNLGDDRARHVLALGCWGSAPLGGRPERSE